MTGGAAPRRKGAGYERDVATWFRANGYPDTERRIGGMADDRGDLTGITERLVVECKNQRAIALGSWFAQLEIETATASAAMAALFIKRRGIADVGRHYVVVSGEHFLELLNAWAGKDAA